MTEHLEIFDGTERSPVVAWLVEPNELSSPGLKREVVFDKPINRPDWTLTPLVRARLAK